MFVLVEEFDEVDKLDFEVFDEVVEFVDDAPFASPSPPRRTLADDF